jgi:hypothetical protein
MVKQTHMVEHIHMVTYTEVTDTQGHKDTQDTRLAEVKGTQAHNCMCER